MHRVILSAVVLATAAAPLGGCRRTPDATAAGVIDSVIPREEALARFRQGLDSVSELTGGATSRDALVQGFIRAVEQRDTAALRAMVMTKAEFAWIYYPTTPQGLPPYDLSPSLLWFMLSERSQQGVAHLVQERFGLQLHVARYACDALPSVEGDNRLWGPCRLYRVQAPGDTAEERLFGSILERHGRFKFVNLSNKL